MTRRLSNSKSLASSERQYLDLLVDIFREDGWDVKRELFSAGKCADLVIARGDLVYIVALKVSSQGRRDRLVALLAQAILEARAAAQTSGSPAVPLAIVAAPLIPRSTVNGLVSFLAEVAPDATVGIFDLEGFRRFFGPGLESLLGAPTRTARSEKLRVPDSANLFSDLNQWMLKVLLAPLVSEDLLQAPRGEYRNATDLAEAAKVSVMSAFRFVRQLRQEGFLDNDSESLRLVRKQELMHRWQATYLRSAPGLPLCWIDRVRNEYRLPAVLRVYNGPTSVRQRPAPRACLGLSAAAELLGFGHVPRILPNFYLESLDRAVLDSMGLSPDGAEYRPDLLVRVPSFQESIFRAAINRDGVPVTDILQVWLELSSHPDRDEAQATAISQRVLPQVFNE
jgi:hypothetical protein